MKSLWKRAGLLMSALLVIASGTGCGAQEYNAMPVSSGAAEKSGLLPDFSGLEQAGKELAEGLLEYAELYMEMEEAARPKELRKGKALKKGDCIGITAPAYSVEGHDFNQAVTFLKNCGFEVKIMDSCYSDNGPFAGDDRQRAEDLNALFADDDVDAILCLRGGYGCARILDYLDYDMIREHPKLLIGYSDITALHIALMQKCGLATVHGPVAASFNSVYSDYIAEKFRNGISLNPDGNTFIQNQWSFSGYYTMEQFLNGISTDKPIGEIELPAGEQLRTLIPGTAQGRIIGGNLMVITTLMGTEYELKGDHAILFLEEVREKSYRIDRMLRQLYQNGLLDRVDGILIGDMSMNEDQDGLTCREVIEEYAALAGKPCITGVPAGHGRNNMFLPFGVEAVMTANEDGTASLKILEEVLEGDDGSGAASESGEALKEASEKEEALKETPEKEEALKEMSEKEETLKEAPGKEETPEEAPEKEETLEEAPEKEGTQEETSEKEEAQEEAPEIEETQEEASEKDEELPEQNEIPEDVPEEGGIWEEIPDGAGIPSPVIPFSSASSANKEGKE